ncbi:HpcH/HpaI aldolase [Gonapodya prolifera JEL478]|uniref:HpcH/HpaI aldolase n=1 Tax=Gonapodya prolifera (strain JEL478) TaxID=1344416 RepID=A0A139AK87_GONPJ|nr:HpcH/HpaI aldolase [Gonapodya prolifera JEL478]|eukprot:KXS17202.1 HpcH/HpaI aldolase [Gonapodya prolifera JEL478]
MSHGGNIIDIFNSGGVIVNGWLQIPSAFAAEVMAGCGFDSICVDMQHGVQDYQSTIACFQGMSAKPVVPLVRVPWSEPGICGKVLDAGAYGVIAPMINSKEECEAFVSYCKYPPMGARSNGPIRAALYGSSDTTYQTTANARCLCIPMIETKQAVDNLAAILDVPGVAGVYIGPSDLGFSYGMKPILDRKEPEILAIYEKIVTETKKRGQFAGIHCGTPEYANYAISLGFRLVTVTADVVAMAMFARSGVKLVRENIAASVGKVSEAKSA